MGNGNFREVPVETSAQGQKTFCNPINGAALPLFGAVSYAKFSGFVFSTIEDGEETSRTISTQPCIYDEEKDEMIWANRVRFKA